MQRLSLLVLLTLTIVTFNVFAAPVGTPELPEGYEKWPSQITNCGEMIVENFEKIRPDEVVKVQLIKIKGTLTLASVEKQRHTEEKSYSDMYYALYEGKWNAFDLTDPVQDKESEGYVIAAASEGLGGDSVSVGMKLAKCAMQSAKDILEEMGKSLKEQFGK